MYDHVEERFDAILKELGELKAAYHQLQQQLEIISLEVARQVIQKAEHPCLVTNEKETEVRC